ncbi:hypothetical protein LENED_009149 [Lentinula edodes]|uniref:Uncharacterized protein n=1 Tax=Lentinula edodes TaxID=5353 RepID=A0A1Q3EJ56_LENED|nr:hypothetical protein LENED_009149 [Lentinula edodes]
MFLCIGFACISLTECSFIKTRTAFLILSLLASGSSWIVGGMHMAQRSSWHTKLHVQTGNISCEVLVVEWYVLCMLLQREDPPSHLYQARNSMNFTTYPTRSASHSARLKPKMFPAGLRGVPYLVQDPDIFHVVPFYEPGNSQSSEEVDLIKSPANPIRIVHIYT